MAIVFYEKKKKEIYIGVGGLLLILILVFVLIKIKGGGFISQEPITANIEVKEVKIDFQKIEEEVWNNFQLFNPISPPSEGVGRDNPFAPLPQTTK
ncbi:MAG: hypothetical protein NTY11_00070 [Candidatus Parcubacteria bacterium]|nr:hypothetical protein [Candidatus Parcubacteria bacterium]